MLLIGIVNASEVSQNTDTDTLSQELVVKDIHTASNADAVPQDKELGADLQTDEKYEYTINESTTKTLNMNKDNDELKEDSEITNWSELAKAVDDAKNKTGQITIMLGNGIYQTNGTIIFNFIVQEFSGFFKPGMNCTFSGLVSIFFLCGWGGEISFQMLSDKCHIICRFIICNIERWGKNFNKLIFFLSFLSTVIIF